MKPLIAFAKTHVICIALLFTLPVLIIVEPALFSFRHFRNILTDAAPLMLLASPFALLAIRGHVDISFGRCAAFAGIIAASLSQSADFSSRMFEYLPRLPVIFPILLVMLLCAGFSALNLFLTKKMRLPPVLTGLIFAGFFQGAITLYLAGKDENDRVLEHFTAGFLAFGTDFAGRDPVFSIPWAVIAAFVICIALAALAPRILRGTGKFAFLPITLICGGLFALSGVMTATKTAAIDSFFMFGADFSALAGILAGGVPLFGGNDESGAVSPQGTVWGAAAGTLSCTAVLYAIDFIFPVNGVSLLVQTLIIGTSLCLQFGSCIKQKNMI